jgi:CRP-like cAMP-binding protein
VQDLGEESRHRGRIAGVAHRLEGLVVGAQLGPRSATAVAVSETTLATVDRHRFLFLVQETPMFALEVMSVMADRLRRRT